jgi:hypothetical protein
MTKEERKIKNKFIYDLSNLLCNDADNDEQFFKKLLWANTYISNALTRFEDIFEEDEENV